ncbi:hypothetical protein ALC53_06943 [Atta colombica]|uniref:Uncharacterized protein n=1 Tax=Atta colombica TaxID=520822 RepID=A0A195BD16_9HYME|nr:hypothetical protein ALC53_06943 [Atta colombica]
MLRPRLAALLRNCAVCDDESTSMDRRSFTAPGDRRVPSASFVNWLIITVKPCSINATARHAHRYRNDARGSIGAMRCDAMRCDAMRRDAMRCDATRCDAMRCGKNTA